MCVCAAYPFYGFISASWFLQFLIARHRASTTFLSFVAQQHRGTCNKREEKSGAGPATPLFSRAELSGSFLISREISRIGRVSETRAFREKRLNARPGDPRGMAIARGPSENHGENSLRKKERERERKGVGEGEPGRTELSSLHLVARARRCPFLARRAHNAVARLCRSACLLYAVYA